MQMRDQHSIGTASRGGRRGAAPPPKVRNRVDEHRVEEKPRIRPLRSHAAVTPPGHQHGRPIDITRSSRPQRDVSTGCGFREGRWSASILAVTTEKGSASKARAAIAVLRVWRPTRSRLLSLVVNALISAAALSAVLAISPGITVNTDLSVLVAVVLLAVVSTLIRPVLVAVAALMRPLAALVARPVRASRRRLRRDRPRARCIGVQLLVGAVCCLAGRDPHDSHRVGRRCRRGRRAAGGDHAACASRRDTVARTPTVARSVCSSRSTDCRHRCSPG